MKDDHPRTWLNEHIEAGIHLGVEARVVLDPGTTWRERADKWKRDLIAGVEAHSPRHAPKVRTVGDVVPETLPIGHVWFEKAAVGLAHTSTGEGLPGNNPLSRLSARIRRAEEVAALWEQNPPVPAEEAEKKEPLAVRRKRWAHLMGMRANHAVAHKIAEDEGEDVDYVKREARRVYNA